MVKLNEFSWFREKKNTKGSKNDFHVLKAFSHSLQKRHLKNFARITKTKKWKEILDAGGIKEFLYFTILWGIGVEK